MAFLAVEGELRRERVASLLWPDSDRARARGALRRTLSVTTKSLGGRSLDAGQDVLALPRQDVECDLWTFESLLDRVAEHGDQGTCPTCLDGLQQAVELRRGGFLEMFALRDCPEFEEWQAVHDERLRRQTCDALDWLVRGHAAAGSFDAAVSFAERRLGLDRLHERTYRQLMLLHAWSDRRSDAVERYRQCVATLSQELGVAPLEETTSLYERLVDGDVPPPPSSLGLGNGGASATAAPATGPVPTLPVGPALPLVGRTAELASLVEILEASSPDGHMVLIEGEAGIGKTRLLDELVAHASRGGFRVLTARCHEDDGRLPHAPLVELARSAFAAAPGLVSELPADDLQELSRLLPELSRARSVGEGPPLDTPEARRRFQEAVSRFLSLPEEGPTLVVIDDAHHADRASLTLLTHLARRLRRRSVCLVLAWRPEATPSDRHLRRLATAARDQGMATTIAPQRLSREDVDTLVARAVPSQSEEISHRMYQETEGLPLLVIEYLAALDLRGGDWQLPIGARERLVGRLESVRGVAKQVLATAAVIGRDFDLDLVCRASGRSQEDTSAALDQLVAGGLLRMGSSTTGDPRWEFGHAKMRQLVYEEAGLARQRLLHGRVADAMRARVRDAREERSIAALLASHERSAGRDGEAVAHHRMAAEHAREVLAFGEAHDHLEAALALGDNDVARIHEQLGDLHTLEGDYVAALASFETAAAHLQDDAPARAAVEQKLAGVHLRRGDRVAAEAHLGAALHLVGSSGEMTARARLLADRSLAAIRSSEPHEAAALASEALELGAAVGDLAVLAQAHNLQAMVARRANRMDEAREHGRESLKLAIALGQGPARIAALNNLGLIERAAGQVEEAVRLHEEALDRCRAGGDRHLEGALANNLADALYAAGRREEAMTHLKEAVARFAEVSDPDVLRPEIWKLVDW